MKATKQALMSNVSDPSANNLNRFVGDANSGIKLTPSQTLTVSMIFIAVVFALHIVGKIFGFGASSAPTPAPVEATEAGDQ